MKPANLKYIVFILFFLSLGYRADAQLNKYYFFNLARNQIAENQLTEAIATLNELIKADGKIADAWFFRGLAKYNLNDLHGSLADFSQAITENPVFSQALLYRGIVYGKMSRYGQALNDFDMAIDLRPNWADAYFSRGVNYLLSQQPQKAITDFSKVIDFEPKNTDAWINRGTSFLYAGDSLRALTDYGQASKLNPFYSEPYSKRGRLLLEMKNYHLALDDLNKAIELDSTSSLNLFFRAIAQNELKNVTAALNDLSRSIEISPNNALSVYNRALIHWQMGSKRQALKDFDRVVELNPENVLVYYNRGVLQIELKDFKEAIHDFTRAIQVFPDFANAYKARSLAHSELGNNKESALDRSFAQSIAERYSSGHSQSLTDTSATFNKLIAFSSDFSPRTTTPLLDEMTSKSVDILPFIRVVAVNSSTLKLLNQHFTPIDTTNQALRNSGIALTFGTSVNPIDKSVLGSNSQYLSHLLNGLNFTSQNRYNSAIDEYRNAVRIMPDNPLAQINLAAELADMVSFIATFEKDHSAITFSQASRHGRNASAYNNLELESYSESLEILDDLRYLLDNHPVVLYNMANIYAHSSQFDVAVKFYSQAIVQNPSLGEAWYNRGLIHFMQKENREGCVDMGKAGELGIRQAYLLIHRFCRR
ncbi:MAG: tetratricopeptide repeat protein [Tenuifilaceae bacterium]|nr:tetratricopeptide repeat protein [Tenuifilaceae bacterium]